MPRGRQLLLVVGAIAGAVAGGCHRLADDMVDYDYDALRIDACERVCHTMDTCEPDRFEGEEPEDCFERCMTLMPRLWEENQCGSREILHFRCVGELSCEEFFAFDAALEPVKNGEAPCVEEFERVSSCSTDEPFDLEESQP